MTLQNLWLQFLKLRWTFLYIKSRPMHFLCSLVLQISPWLFLTHLVVCQLLQKLMVSYTLLSPKWNHILVSTLSKVLWLIANTLFQQATLWKYLWQIALLNLMGHLSQYQSLKIQSLKPLYRAWATRKDNQLLLKSMKKVRQLSLHLWHSQEPLENLLSNLWKWIKHKSMWWQYR